MVTTRRLNYESCSTENNVLKQSISSSTKNNRNAKIKAKTSVSTSINQTGERYDNKKVNVSKKLVEKKKEVKNPEIVKNLNKPTRLTQKNITNRVTTRNQKKSVILDLKISSEDSGEKPYELKNPKKIPQNKNFPKMHKLIKTSKKPVISKPITKSPSINYNKENSISKKKDDATRINNSPLISKPKNIKKSVLNKPPPKLLELQVILERIQIPLENQIKQKSPTINKRVQFEGPSTKRNLRNHKNQNYAESSLDNTTIINPPIDKIPIYKQSLSVDKEQRKKDDLYDFDSDSETKNKRKRRKIKDNDSSYKEYNKKIDGILKKVITKVKRKLKPALVNKDINKKIDDNENLINKISCAITESLEKNNDDNATSVKLLASNQSNAENKIIDDMNSDDELFFGFENNAPKSPPKINIISNIKIKSPLIASSIDTPAKFKTSQPTANSTMINNRALKPWRFNEMNIKRNPHFLNVKSTALPNINQDVVLDHTFCDKLDDRWSKVDEKRPKTPKQSTMLDYISHKIIVDESEKENISCLFDTNELSPIKNNFTSTNKNFKQNILTPRNIDNSNMIQAVSTPVSRSSFVSNSSPTNDLHEKVSLFGFDDSNEGVIEADDLKKKSDKPFRLSVNLVKQYSNKKKSDNNVKNLEEVLEASENNIESEREDELNEENNEYINGGLFEDFQRDKTPMKINSKRKLKWLIPKEDAEKRKKSRKKAKDEFTEEEEEAFNKWAESFNSMCEEIEKFPLEVE